MIVLLDSGPLWRVISPAAHPLNLSCSDWLENLLASRAQVRIPEIVDYAIRREAIRARQTQALERLEALETALGYVPVTTESMRTAAAFWAEARIRGYPTAPDPALDVDMILSAQAATTRSGADPTVIATENVRHLSLFTIAWNWQE